MADPKHGGKHLKPHHFRPGVSGNPKGRPPISKEQRELRKLTIERYREIINIALTGNLEELKAYIQDADTPAIQVGVATALLKGIKNGDVTVLEHFAARLVGKIPDTINITSSNVTVKDKISGLSDDEIEQRLTRIRKSMG